MRSVLDSRLSSRVLLLVLLVLHSIYYVVYTRVIENKIRTENNEIIHMGVFPRRRAALRAARAAGWRGVD